MQPYHYYWALFALLALPSSLFCRVAAVVVAVRVISQIAYNYSLPEPETQLWIYAAAFFISFAVARRASDFSAAALFVPLAVTMYYWTTQRIEPVQGYWAMFGFNTLQLLFLPLGVRWNDVSASLRQRKMPALFPPYDFRVSHA